MMENFLIDGVDFGVDLKSTFKVRRAENCFRVSFDIYGNQEMFSGAIEKSDVLSWVLYPPCFYLHDFGIEAESIDSVNFDYRQADLDEIESAFYCMDHWDVDEVVVRVLDGRFYAEGFVIIEGARLKFSIGSNVLVAREASSRD